MRCSRSPIGSRFSGRAAGGHGPAREADQNQLIRMMVGRSLGEIFLRASRRGMHRRWRSGTWAEPDRSPRSRSPFGRARCWECRPGRQRRTQVARCIFGADPFEVGEISPRREPDPSALATRRGQVGDRPADRGPQARRVGDALHHSRQRQHGVVRPAEPLGVLNRRAQAAEVQHKIEELDIRLPLEPACPSAQRRESAEAGAGEVAVDRGQGVILDEPTRGVDVATKVEIYQLISDLAAQGSASC